jgi:Sulfotransferase family
MAEPAFDPMSLALGPLLAEAAAKSGRARFEDESFREPLARLLGSLDREAALSPAGRATQHARIVESLVMRHGLEQHEARHPEIRREEIAAPLVIVGLARTGTTMLHRLLSADPGLYSARWWEVRFPAPFLGWDWRGPDPRIAEARAQVAWILEHQPVLAAIHPWDAEGPDEEVMLIEHSFLSHVPESGANLPSYRAWLDGQDLRPAYALLRRLLQFLQWQKRRRGETAERWVLKTPMHLGHLDVLFESFPGAHVIQTHRDPLETIPSVASMYLALWGLGTEKPDPLEVGRQCLDRYARALARCLAVRETLPAERFVDVSYRDVARDPLGTVRRIYAAVGRELTHEAEAAMAAWVAKNPREHRPPHEYTLESFGYTREAIEQAFAAYRARFVAKPGAAP